MIFWISLRETRGSNMIHYFPVFSLDESTELGKYHVQVPKSLSHIHWSIVTQEMITTYRRINAQKLESPSPSRSGPRRHRAVPKTLSHSGQACRSWRSRSRCLRCVAWSPKMPSRSGPIRRHAVAHDAVAQMAKLVGVATVNLPKSPL